MPGFPLFRRLFAKPSGSSPTAPVSDEEWVVSSVLQATAGGLFGEGALYYDTFPSKEIAEREARSLEAVTGRPTIVQTAKEARGAAEREKEEFSQRLLTQPLGTA